MQRQLFVALGAGLTSALLFVVSAKGSMAAALIAYFTALPIMIAAVGFGHVSGLAGAVLGMGAVAFGLGPVLGAFFALCFAIPGWWLGYLVLLARPVAAAGAPTLVWYPVARIVTWAAALAVAAVMLLGGAVLWRYGGYDAAMTLLAKRLDAVVEQSPNSLAAALLFVKILPLAMAASLFLMLCVNLWLAGRVARLSDRLRRPWPDIADGLRLPRLAGIAFVLSLLPIAMGGPIGTVAGVLAAALGLALALEGLATAHVLTRGFAARRGILGLIYIVTLVIPVAVAALCILGLIDCLFSLRAKQPPSRPVPTPL